MTSSSVHSLFTIVLIKQSVRKLDSVLVQNNPSIYIYSSAPGALSTLGTSVVLYSVTRATLMSPGKDETRVCGYIYIYVGSFYTFCLHLFYRSILRLFLLPNVFLLLIVLYPLIVLYRLDTLS